GGLLAPLRGAGEATVVITVTLALLVFHVAKNVLVAALAWQQYGWGAEARATLARRVYAAYLAAPWSHRLQRSSADLIRNVTMGVDAVLRHVLGPAMVLATETLVVAAIAAVLFATAPGLTLAVTIGLGGAAALLLAATRARSTRWGAELLRLERDVL